MNLTLLGAFIPTFFFVSITPGMCMTLAFSLGISLGYRRTLWMMVGELLGVGIVAIAAVLGIATLLLNYPLLFISFKVVGGAYLCFVGWQMWQSKGKLALSDTVPVQAGRRWQLMGHGFVTAIANPKGWAFMVSLLPPFIDHAKPLTPQLTLLVSIILLSEFVCMTLYATGGRGLKALLTNQNNVKLLNRLSGSLMILVGIWLFFT
ncbi:LysE family translocator [Vibrio sp. SM6]|uniref:LysE family translocator n=1 Tax=Vibrio agarilyticus TaxID=2726741 RepID=A0A7X8TP66_9VIBR|nr:LysE family translocator [Vibrio agarilyticus]NLS12165.1 LysE family translocator [Vibrio agarilyticus]